MHEILTHEDDLFGRVALFNGLVTLEQIIECARTMVSEAVAGRPRRPLAAVLIARGFLAPRRAGAVEEAIRKRMAGTAHQESHEPSAPAAPSRKPPPMASRAPSGVSQIMVAAGEETGDSAQEAEDRLKKIVAKLAPGRIYPEMLQYVTRHRLSVIDSHKLAAELREPEKAVVAALQRWLKAGVLRRMGTHPYNFSPTAEQEEEIRVFLDAWSDPRRHAHVLGMVLEVEEHH